MARRSLLLIDDNVDLLQTLTTRLAAEGFEVAAAASGEEGLQATKDRAFDLIILDMLMPEPDGIETYQALRAAPATRGIPVILLTAIAVEGHWETLPHEPDGACYVMGKPYDLSVLVKRIRQVFAELEQGSAPS